MAELRRLLIDQKRLNGINQKTNSICLNDKEAHYLRRVLRLRKGDELIILNGTGSFWKATLVMSNTIALLSSITEPELTAIRESPLICLAVAIPKRGIEEMLRMCTEIGVDIFQPIVSSRTIINEFSESRYARFDSILIEAAEQSERLWKPELRKPLSFRNWLKQPFLNASCSIATTRQSRQSKFEIWLNELPQDLSYVWTAIGPEGGWSQEELTLAKNSRVQLVDFGSTILRTSTAAISASQLVASWKRSFK